jgi:polysaccharide deacetylase 2 family uncharacterized protein YibQ
MRLVNTLLLLIFLGMGGVAAWLYVENDQRSVSRVELPGDGTGDGAAQNGDRALTAVDPDLTEQGPHGPLPRINEGREPWRVYARPFVSREDRPKIAVVITGLGLDRDVTSSAIEQLPGSVTLAFTAYGSDLPADVDRARRQGHEVLIGVAAEPADSEHVDPGRWALLSSLDGPQNIERLYWNMGRTAGYVGILIRDEGPFMRSTNALVPVLLDLKARGVMFVDARPISAGALPEAAEATGVVYARATAWIDSDPTGSAIDAQLARAEAVAQASGVALVMGQAYPITIDRVRQWVGQLEQRGFSLAPVTATANTGGTR